MRFSFFAVEALENRTLLAADVAVETVDVLPQESLPGDANMDGTFDSPDFIQVLQAGKYLTGEQAGWAEGDWNGDGNFDQLDVVLALQTGRYDALGVAARGAAANTPYKGKGVFFDIGDRIEGLPPHTPPQPVEGATRVMQIFDQGEANGTQLGKHTIKFSAYLHFPASGPPIAISDGFGVNTAANGDQLFFRWVPGHVRFFPEPPGLPGHSEIVGGTGRFQDATGQYQWTSAIDANGQRTFEWDGSITSVGQN